jgi:hypothetical protein
MKFGVYLLNFIIKQIFLFKLAILINKKIITLMILSYIYDI